MHHKFPGIRPEGPVVHPVATPSRPCRTEHATHVLTSILGKIAVLYSVLANISSYQVFARIKG